MKNSSALTSVPKRRGDEFSNFPVRWLLMVAGTIMLLQLGACGVKTAPYPEAATLPEKIQGLTQTFSEDGELTLSWMPPKKNMVGRPLTKLGGFEIAVSDNVANESYCLGCPHTYVTVDMVPAASPPPGMVLAPGPYNWRFPTQVGRVYRFRVSSVAASGGIHPRSRVETLVWSLEAPGALPGFSVTMGDRAVELGWFKLGGNIQVDIQKRLPEGTWDQIPGLEQNLGRFSDLGVAYEQSYIYRGRSARLKDNTSQPGPWSREITIKVVDLIPPHPPGHLDAALTTNGVQLSWESLTFNPDVAGYRVYRQVQGEAGFVRIGPVLLRENIFFDPISLSGDVVARYQVTAVDQSPHKNESLPSPTVDVLLDPPPELPVRP